MKKLLLVLLLFAGGVQAQILNLYQFAKKEDVAKVNKRIDSLNAAKNGTVVTPPVTTLKPCARKPTIADVFGITKTGASVRFDAEGVTNPALDLYTGSGVFISSTDFVAKNNVLILSYQLNSGEYQIKIRATNCDAEVSPAKTFKIAETGIVVDPPVIVVPSDPVNAIQTIAKGMDQHLNLTINQTADGIILNDISTEGKGSNYDYWYGIGADVLKSDTPLKNYLFQGRNPLQVWKMKGKKGLDTFYRWDEGNAASSTWFWADAGESFSYNTSIAFHDFSFVGAQSKTGFLNHIPQSYDPSSQFTQWADIVPDLKLPDDRLFFLSQGDWSYAKVLQKGVTAISHYRLPWSTSLDSVLAMKKAGLTYNDVPITTQIFNLPNTGVDKWENGYNRKYWVNGPFTNDQARAAARGRTLDRFWIGETTEGDSYMPFDNSMWFPFYDELDKEYQDQFGKKGRKYYIAHSYLNMWAKEFNLGTDGGTRDLFKARGKMKPEDLPKTVYSPGGNLSKTNLILETVYLNNPDANSGILGSIYHMNMARLMGYEGGVFIFGVHEWRPNNPYQINYPDGKFFVQNKAPLDPNVVFGLSFLSNIYGKVFVEWGAPGKQSTKDLHPGEAGFWFPTGATSQQGGFPHTQKPGYVFYSGSSDLCRFGLQLWADTFGRLEGGDYKYLDFRLNGGEWVKAQNLGSDDVVDAFYDVRPIVYSVTKGDQIAWFYLDPRAKNLYKTLDVRFPSGKVVTNLVSGNGVHAKIESI